MDDCVVQISVSLRDWCRLSPGQRAGGPTSGPTKRDGSRESFTSSKFNGWISPIFRLRQHGATVAVAAAGVTVAPQCVGAPTLRKARPRRILTTGRAY